MVSKIRWSFNDEPFNMVLRQKKSESNLFFIFQLIHSDQRPFSCSVCKSKFKQLAQLKNHSVIHMDKEKDVVSWNSNDNVYGAKLQVVVIWIFLKTGCHFVEWHIIQNINKKQKKTQSKVFY